MASSLLESRCSRASMASGASTAWITIALAPRTPALAPVRLREIRRISLAIAVSVAAKAYAMKLARQSRPRDLRRSIEALMYKP